VAGATTTTASRPAAASNEGNTEAGFVDLINLLLAPQDAAEAASASDQQGAPPDVDPSAGPLVRSPHEIAESLIKAMSMRKHPDVSTNVFSDSPDGKPATRKQRDSLRGPLAETFVQTPASAPHSQQTTAVEQILNSGPKTAAAATAVGDAVKPSHAAPLAFALKLTPKDSAAKDSAAPDSGDFPNAASLKAVPNDRPAVALAPTQEPQTSAEVKPVAQAETSSAAQDGGNRDALAVRSRLSGDDAGTAPSGGQALQATPVRAFDEAPQLVTRSQETVITPPPSSAANALRSATPVALASPPQNSAAQGIAVRIERSETAVDVHVMERAGQVHVAVRTPDAGLQTSLRQDLGTLVNSLDRAGFHADAAIPHNVAAQSFFANE
jgi:hypothetical protein